MIESNKYDRQSRITGWNQKKISYAKVMVLGAGALGNEIVKNLALIGVGNILIVDFDIVELPNLSRTALFSINDLGLPKAQTLAKAANKLNPDIVINYINGDILFDIGLGFYRNVDLVIGALDNLAARSQANSCANLVGKPFIDSGVWAHGGEVKWFFPSNSACFDCLMSNSEKNILAERYSCTGFMLDTNFEDGSEAIFASTLAPVAIMAGIATQEICYFICGIREIIPGEAIVYNGLQLSIHRSILPRNSGCHNHIDEPYKDIFLLPNRVGDTTARELIQFAQSYLGSKVTIELGRDFLLSLKCENCNEIEFTKTHIARVRESMSRCKNCNQVREKKIYTSLNSEDEISDMKLGELCVPIGDILMLHSSLGSIYLELSNDVKQYYL